MTVQSYGIARHLKKKNVRMIVEAPRASVSKERNCVPPLPNLPNLALA